MKMLTRDSDRQYLIELKQRLEANGIPAVIQGENTARMIVPIFLLQPTLWVYLDEQFEDAIKLMDNPDHEVSSKIDMEEFYAMQPSEEQQAHDLNAALLHLLLIVGVVMLGLYALIKVLE